MNIQYLIFNNGILNGLVTNDHSSLKWLEFTQDFEFLVKKFATENGSTLAQSKVA